MSKQTEKPLQPIFCRVGAKTLMRFQILKYIPNHMIYVEPFIGGGAVFWNKPSAEASVINDLDKQLINDYNLIKSAPTDISKYRSQDKLNTLQKRRDFITKNHTTKPDKLIDAILRRCSGFSSKYIKKGKENQIYQVRGNPLKKIKNLQRYKDKLKTTIIKNQDYKKIIKDYDTYNTFFYLDPPYEESDKGFYDDNIIDYEEMSNILKKIKGKFALSINGSSYIKKTFKDFKIIKLELKTNAKVFIGSKKREELLIMNY
ncbi:MAG: hypothetical protein CMJ25_03120 [Phycisphaerae bacterium]|nr:hypothetical protein [Phycisphaerae bacterium]|tara:strand:+ start:583 stop:1359 length:777 start_codon:yes stop_codon:yes gene_type:complete